MSTQVTILQACASSLGPQAVGATPVLPDAEADLLVAIGRAVYTGIDASVEVRVIYDGNGNVSEIIEQGGDARGTGKTVINYDDNGDVSSVIADGQIITISKDSSGKVLGVNIQ